LSLCLLCSCAEAPCLSFDVVTDALGYSREEFPLTCYLVAGTQASRAQANAVIVMKLSNLCKTQKADDDSDDDRLILLMMHSRCSNLSIVQGNVIFQGKLEKSVKNLPGKLRILGKTYK